MPENEMNNVTEEVVENAAELADTVTTVEPTFAQRHPYLALMGTGAALGTGVLGVTVLGGLMLEGGKKLWNWGKNKIAARKEAKAQKAVIENSEEDNLE